MAASGLAELAVVGCRNDADLVGRAGGSICDL